MATTSRTWLEVIARELGPLRHEVVFVGGAILDLLIDDPGSAGIRTTDDVDVIVDVASRRRFNALAARLRKLGFAPDTSDGAPICRWNLHGLVVDVMPTSEAILGFANRWYAEAIARSVEHELEPGLTIRTARAPHFVGMKLEAFAGRGGGDLVASHDLEDIIAVVDGRAALVDEVAAESAALKAYLAARVRALLDDDAFHAALPGHLAGDAASQARRPLVLDRLRRIARLG